MALRFLVRKLRIPATAALEPASSHRVSSAMGSLASRNCSSEGNRAVNGIKKAQLTLKEMEKRSKRTAQDYKRVVKFMDNLPRRIALSAAGGIFAGVFLVAYAFGGLGGSRK